MSRLGIVLLNLVAPGLGLARLGLWKLALAAFAVSLAVLLFFHVAPPVSFGTLLLVVILGLLTVVASMILSWRHGGERRTSLPWYAEWYSVLGAGILALAINFFLTDPKSFRYRNFYIPSETMEPSLKKGDRFIAYMGSLGALGRGDLVLVRSSAGTIYVKRVAAIGGDRFAMKGGVVVLNGLVVPQRMVGMEVVQSPVGAEPVRRLAEKFPGEASDHEIYDAGPSAGDDIAELQVPSDAVYLLGDNRDNSADSRFPSEYGGLGGPVPISAIAGRPYYESWGSSRSLGTKLSSAN